jgi:glucose-6-phosphate-specific signal transduction histidine kinase
VADDGSPDPAQPIAEGGLGIPGMKERAALLGGTLTAGPGPLGGFIVTARLPAPKGAEMVPTHEHTHELPGQKAGRG